MGENAPSTVRIHRVRAGTIDSLDAVPPILRTDAGRLWLSAYARQIDELGGRPPRKSEFKPWLLRGALASTLLFDVTDSGNPIFSIVGDTVVHRFGRNPVGRPYREFVRPERLRSALKSFQHCAEYPCGMLVLVRQCFESGLYMRCEAFGLPLLNDAGTRASHLVFTDAVVDAEKTLGANRGEMIYANVIARSFIDLGFGCPDDFEDVVIEEEPS